MLENYKLHIEAIPDFPVPGILYRDIQPLLENPHVFKNAVIDMRGLTNELPAFWAGIESRGFLFASALSICFGGGVRLIRKKGKLPNPQLQTIDYGLEYGKGALEIDVDRSKGSVIIVDDVVATSGTFKAAEDLCTRAGLEVIERIALIDIGIVEHNVKCLIKY